MIATGCTPSPGRSHPAPDPVAQDSREAADHVAAGPLHGRTGAYLIVRDAASQVRIRLADLPGLLYRVSTPPGAGLAPRVDGPDGRARVRLRPSGGDGPDTVTIVLNRSVRWDIRLPAGAGEQRLDLREGRLARVELGDCGLADVRLPPADRLVPVVLTGPVGSFRVAAAGTPLRFRLAAGADRVMVPWAAAGPVRPGAIVASPGWAAAADRYAVDARSTVGVLAATR